MKLPIHFYKPLAVGAPQPIRELPVRPERVIHFFPPHVEKIRARIPEVAKQVDVLCGNLEDAIPMDAKEAARAGFIEVARTTDFGDTALWVRVNALNSPWVLDDIAEIVATVGHKLDVMMIPKVEGPWDIHFVDQYLALLEAKHQIQKPILIHALLETAQGMMNLEAIAGASPRMHGFSLGPADLAASRGMKTTRVGGGHPFYGVLADPQEGRSIAPSTSKTCGTTQLRAWSMLPLPTDCAPSTDRSATSRMKPPARHSSATPSSSAAPAPGRLRRTRFRLPSASSAPMSTKSCSPNASSTPCLTDLASP